MINDHVGQRKIRDYASGAVCLVACAEGIGYVMIYDQELKDA